MRRQLNRDFRTLSSRTLGAALRRGRSVQQNIQRAYDDRYAPPPSAPPAPEPEWYQSEPITKTSKLINTAACVFGLLYAGLAIRQVSENLSFSIVYGASSFLMNAPLSWFFTIKLIDATIRLKKKQPLYISAYTVAMLLAIGSTAAGVQLAKESADSLENFPDWLRMVSIVLFSFNRFCTRFIGSLNILHAIFRFAADEYYKRFTKNRIYYQLLYDIKHYSLDNFVTPALQRKSDALNLKVFAREFYQGMPAKGQNPGETEEHYRNKMLVKTATLLIISIFILNMQPLWLKLSVEGIEFIKPIRSWSQNTWAVWFAALSNQFFFLYMASTFLPSIISVTKIAAPKIKTKLNTVGSAGKFGILIGTAFASIIWGVSAYYSGSGYSTDATEAMENGFGNIADETWFSWFAGSWTQVFMPVYNKMIATTSAGLFVNGSSTLSFLMEYVSFFQPEKPKKDYSKIDADDAIRILKDLIAKHNFSRLKRHGEDIRDKIKDERDRAEPHPSIWANVFCCPPREIRGEEKSLTSAAVGGSRRTLARNNTSRVAF